MGSSSGGIGFRGRTAGGHDKFNGYTGEADVPRQTLALKASPLQLAEELGKTQAKYFGMVVS